jgi:hypothetical protein
MTIVTLATLLLLSLVKVRSWRRKDADVPHLAME